MIELLNQDLATLDSRCLKRHTSLNPKKTKFIVVSRSVPHAPGYGNLTHGGADFEKEKESV